MHTIETTPREGRTQPDPFRGRTQPREGGRAPLPSSLPSPPPWANARASTAAASAPAAAASATPLPAPLPAGWPAHGRVEFRSASLRYRPGLPLALDCFSLVARPGERVGVVGRSGSGEQGAFFSFSLNAPTPRHIFFFPSFFATFNDEEVELSPGLTGGASQEFRRSLTFVTRVARSQENQLSWRRC